MAAVPDPQLPADLAANAGRVAIDAHSRLTAVYDSFMAAKILIREEILASLGETNRLLITDPVSDLITMPTLEIIDYFRQLYGILSADTIANLKASLRNPFLGMMCIPYR